MTEAEKKEQIQKAIRKIKRKLKIQRWEEKTFGTSVMDPAWTKAAGNPKFR